MWAAFDLNMEPVFRSWDWDLVVRWAMKNGGEFPIMEQDFLEDPDELEEAA
jgi:hypothetical protein